ncbi:MAG: lipocalin-like domain-containing protein [Gammaproteobacteria bacterium]|jgi:predicted secreted hydrolase
MTRNLTVAGTVSIALLFALFAATPGNASENLSETAKILSPAELLAAANEGDFARAKLPYPFSFPRDYGSHREYRTETWHLSGILQAKDQPQLGLQLAIIRIALGSQPPHAGSTDWASGEIYAALFSLSDPADGDLHTGRRLSRGGIGLAGWQARPMQLWVEDWQVKRSGDETGARLEIQLSADDLKLELELRQRKPLVDHNRIRNGKDGAAPPFVYYVEPRLEASGILFDGKRSIELSGRVSIEHAWGELPLPGGPVVQDRFNLYLADGRELFLVRSHRRDGSGAPTTAGLLIRADDTPVLLDGAEIDLRAGGFWTSERTGSRYPLRWSLSVPGQAIELELITDRKRQEGMLWAPFWSGPVRLVQASGPAAGDGYMQLNGYPE